MKITLTVHCPNNTEETYTFRGLKSAHAAYDKAIALGYYVCKFGTETSDMRDRPQSAIISAEVR
jgi:hypothetical protein